MSHFKNVCKCGAVISQCRCASPDKIERVVQDTCSACVTTPEKRDDAQAAVVEAATEIAGRVMEDVEKLGEFLMTHYPREIGRGYPDGTDAGGEGAIATVMRLLTPGGANPAPRDAESEEDWSGKLSFRETAIRLTLPTTVEIRGDAIQQIADAVAHRMAEGA